MDVIGLWAFGGVLLTLLVLLTWTDVKSFLLPDVLTFPLIAFGLVFSSIYGNIYAALGGMCVGYSIFVAIEISFKVFMKKDGLGRGDAKLLAGGGAWCGLGSIAGIVLLSSFSALLFLALYGVVRKVRGKKSSSKNVMLPFGPFLALAIMVVWGEHYILNLS